MNKKFIANNLSSLSLLLSGLCVAGILAINYNIALAYNRVDGKTKAIFGIIELSYIEQYFLLIPISIALILGISAYIKGNNKSFSIIATLFASSVIILLFSRVWRLML